MKIILAIITAIVVSAAVVAIVGLAVISCMISGIQSRQEENNGH